MDRGSGAFHGTRSGRFLLGAGALGARSDSAGHPPTRRPVPLIGCWDSKWAGIASQEVVRKQPFQQGPRCIPSVPAGAVPGLASSAVPDGRLFKFVSVTRPVARTSVVPFEACVVGELL